MTDKTIARNAAGQPEKMPGWFSWRHQTRDAHDEAVAKYGGTARERRDQRRAEAIARNAKTPFERTAAFRRQQEAA